MRMKGRKKFSTLLKRKQRRLGNLINLTLVGAYEGQENDDKLRYYQGYHDVASVFLSALGGGHSGSYASSQTSPEGIAASMGLDLPSRVLCQVSQTHLRDAMRSSFQDLQAALRLVLMPLINAVDREVHDFLEGCDMEPFFCLSWIITWFSHDVRDTDLVKRLFDAFLVSHPTFALYMTVAMLCHPYNRTEVLSCEQDFATVHHVLSGLPRNSSMVGFVYRLGDGYVSGTEEDEDGTASTDPPSTDLDSSMAFDEVESTLEEDIVSSTPVDSNVKAPFQEIIDKALVLMRRIPPRSLEPLAARYYTQEELGGPLLARASSVTMLTCTPPWALVATTPADWVIKQRARTRSGRSRSSRRDRRSLSPMRRQVDPPQSQDLSIKTNERDEDVEAYLKEHCRTLAVIACGFGPGDDEINRRRRKRRKQILVGGVALALLALSCVVLMSSSATMSESGGQANEDPTLLRESRTLASFENETGKGGGTMPNTTNPLPQTVGGGVQNTEPILSPLVQEKVTTFQEKVVNIDSHDLTLSKENQDVAVQVNGDMHPFLSLAGLIPEPLAMPKGDAKQPRVVDATLQTPRRTTDIAQANHERTNQIDTIHPGKAVDHERRGPTIGFMPLDYVGRVKKFVKTKVARENSVHRGATNDVARSPTFKGVGTMGISQSSPTTNSGRSDETMALAIRTTPRDVPRSVQAASKALRSARKAVGHFWRHAKDHVHEDGSEHFVL